MAGDEMVSQSALYDPKNRAKVQQAISLIQRGKAGIAGQDPALRPYVNTLSAMGVRTLQNLSIRLGQEEALREADIQKAQRTINLPAKTQEPIQEKQLVEPATAKGSKQLMYKPKRIEPATKTIYETKVVSQEEYDQRMKDQAFETMTVTDLPAKKLDSSNVTQRRPPTFKEKASAFYNKAYEVSPFKIGLNRVTGIGGTITVGEGYAGSIEKPPMPKEKQISLPDVTKLNQINVPDNSQLNKITYSPRGASAVGLLTYGFMATPTAIIKSPNIVGVTYAGYTQKVGSKGIVTEQRFTTTTGYKGFAKGYTETEIVGNKLVLGDTSVAGGMGKPSVSFGGNTFWTKPKAFFSQERSVSFADDIVRDLDIGKITTNLKGLIMGGKGEVVSIGKPPQFSFNIAKTGKADVPITKQDFTSISLGLKGGDTTLGVGVARTESGFSVSSGILKDLSSQKPPKINYKYDIEIVGGGNSNLVSTQVAEQIIKEIALERTRSGILAGTIPPPTSTFKFVTPKISGTGFGNPILSQANKPIELFSSTFVVPKSVTVTIPKIATKIKPDTKSGFKLGLESITKTRGGLSSKTKTEVITIPKPKEVIKTDTRVIQSPALRSTTITTPRRIQKIVTTTTTPTITIPETVIIKRPFPFPPLPSLFMDKGTGSGFLKGGTGYTYKPSFSAIKFNLFGKEPTKKTYTGLELRPIPKGFSWFKKKKRWRNDNLGGNNVIQLQRG